MFLISQAVFALHAFVSRTSRWLVTIQIYSYTYIQVCKLYANAFAFFLLHLPREHVVVILIRLTKAIVWSSAKSATSRKVVRRTWTTSNHSEKHALSTLGWWAPRRISTFPLKVVIHLCTLYKSFMCRMCVLPLSAIADLKLIKCAVKMRKEANYYCDNGPGSLYIMNRPPPLFLVSDVLL